MMWILLVGLWLYNSRFSQKETVYGWLSPPSGVVRVYPEQSGGMVASLLIEEGQTVVKGQTLLIVESGRVLADGVTLESKLLEEYTAQRDLIEQQLKRGDAIAQRNTNEAISAIKSAERELQLINQQFQTTEARHTLIEGKVNTTARLNESGHVSTAEYNAVVTEELLVRAELQNLERAAISQSSLINRLQSELEKLPENAQSIKEQQIEKLSQLSQQIVQLTGSESYVIAAPRSGIVNNLQLFEGQQLATGSNSPLFSILPEDSSLTAQLLVPVRSAGFVETGQPLNIRYDAFPYQKFGIYDGVIDSISKTLLLPGEILNSPIRVAEPVYRIVATLDGSNVQAYGQTFSLKPGMTLSADIKLGERSLVEWLFAPILSLRGAI